MFFLYRFSSKISVSNTILKTHKLLLKISVFFLIVNNMLIFFKYLKFQKRKNFKKEFEIKKKRKI